MLIHKASIMRPYILSFFLIIISVATAFADSVAEMADSAYNRGDFKDAETLYLQAAQIDGVSPQLYYNLGNTYYRLSQLGKSVIYYERALRLDPSMEDARTNLDFVNTKILDKPEDDSTFLGNLHRSILSIMSPNAWAWTAFGFFVVVLLCVALYVFSGVIIVRKSGFFGGFIALMFFIYAIVLASQSANAISRDARAVVVVPTSNLSTTPGASAGTNAKIIPVHEGTVVEIVDSILLPGEDTWYDVKINNATRAWVKASDVEKI